MNPNLKKLEKYGFEIAPDKGMQIAMTKWGLIYLSPGKVPQYRIHAVMNGDGINIHYDQDDGSGVHKSQKFHQKAEQVRYFMKWVEYEIDIKPNQQLLHNLPKTTKVYENKWIRKGIRWLSTSKFITALLTENISSKLKNIIK